MEAANGQGGGRPTGSTPSAPSLNSANLPLWSGREGKQFERSIKERKKNERNKGLDWMLFFSWWNEFPFFCVLSHTREGFACRLINMVNTCSSWGYQHLHLMLQTLLRTRKSYLHYVRKKT
jgi:hypothetical protein